MKDWRGVEVKAGDTVIYTTRQGSSMTHTEATIESVDEYAAKAFVVRRSYNGGRDRVVVSGVHLTVVSGLPEATIGTNAEANEKRAEWRRQYEAKRDAA